MQSGRNVGDRWKDVNTVSVMENGESGRQRQREREMLVVRQRVEVS